MDANFVLADAAAAAAASVSGRGNETEERAAPVKNVVKHVLSQELLLYLERVTGLLRGLLLAQKPSSRTVPHDILLKLPEMLCCPKVSSLLKEMG